MTRKQAIKEFKREGMIIPESAVKLAISDMEKLEKIEQILKDIPYGGGATVRRIQEVLEKE